MLQTAHYLRRWLTFAGSVLYVLLIAFLVLNGAALTWAYRWLEAEKVRLAAAMKPKDARTIDSLADALNALYIDLGKVEAKAEKARRIAQSVSGQVGNQRRQEQEQQEVIPLPENGVDEPPPRTERYV